MAGTWWTIALQTVNFLLLVWLLQRFLYRPVLAVLARRRQDADAVRAKAAGAEAAAGEARAALEAEKASLEAQKASLLEEAHRRAEEERAAVLKQVRQEAQGLSAAARQAIDDERRIALRDLRGRVAELATALATRLLNDLGPATAAGAFLERIDAYLAALPADELAALRRQIAQGTVQVVTAQPLDAAAAESWRARLGERLGADVGIDFSTDAALIAGAELRFAGAVLRFNWRDTLDQAARDLLKTGEETDAGRKAEADKAAAEAAKS